MSPRRLMTLSSEDQRILKALDPFSLITPITLAPPNMICGYKNRRLSWLFHTDATVDLEVEQPADMSYQMARMQNFDVCEATTHAEEIAGLMRRIVYPDLDITVLGKWYVPRAAGLAGMEEPYTMFGLTGIYPVNGGQEGAKREWPVVEKPDGTRLLAVPTEPLVEVLTWFREHSPGQPQILWLDIPGYAMPMCHIRGGLESPDHKTMTTVYFLLAGIIDREGGRIGESGGIPMTEKTHLRNGGSSAERWMSCPGSIRLSAQVPEKPRNEAQEQGTLAHRVFEAMLRTGEPSVSDLCVCAGQPAYPPDLIPAAELEALPDEMAEGVEWAVEQVYEQMTRFTGSDPLSLDFLFRSEWMGDFSAFGMPQCGGTLDAVLVQGGGMHVYDLKYGWKAVAPEANPQLMLYGLQALLMLPDGGWKDIQTVTLHVLQPKVSRQDLYWRTTPAVLMDWGMSSLRFAYERTFAEDAPCIPSDTACHWCPASGLCRVAYERGLERITDLKTFSPETIPASQIAPILEQEAAVNTFFKALWSRAYDLIKAGQEVPGLKVVNVVTRYKFEEDAVQALQKILPQEDLFEFKVRSPNQLSLVKGGAYKALANQYKTRPERCKIALESDKRPAVSAGKMTMFEALSLNEGE